MAPQFARSLAILAQAPGGRGGGGLFDSGTIWLIILVGLLIAALVFFAIFARYCRLWIQSFATGAGIGFLDLLRMTFRKVNPTVIVRSKIMAVQAGLNESEGITTVRHLVSRSEDQLLNVRNFGETTLKEVRAKLHEIGLDLGMNVPLKSGA